MVENIPSLEDSVAFGCSTSSPSSLQSIKNSTTGAGASGKYQLAGIHKFINALTTHSE